MMLLMRPLKRRTAWSVAQKPWAYDQFEPEVMTVVLDSFLASVRTAELADPVLDHELPAGPAEDALLTVRQRSLW